jgi:hypothetical protein
MRALSGGVFGVLGIILLVRVLIIPAPLNAKLIGIALPVVMIALAAVRIREYLHGRGAPP